MATNWTDAEVFKFIEVWGEQGIQEQLEGSKSTFTLDCPVNWQSIEWRSGEQCRCKVKKLRQEYKKIKDDLNMTGRGRTM